MASRPRTQKVPESAWLQHKDSIVDLYLREDLPVGTLAERMRADHGLNATISQYEAQLKAWNVRKNLKVHEWEPILERIDRLPSDSRSRIILSGQPVPDHRIQRARRHCKSRSAKKPRLEGQLEYSEAADVFIEIQRLDGTWSKLEETEALPATTGSSQPRFESVADSGAVVLSGMSTDTDRPQQHREINGPATRYDFDSWINSPGSPRQFTLPDVNMSMDQIGTSQLDDMAQYGWWDASLFGLQRENESPVPTTPSFSSLPRARSIPRGPKLPTLYLPPQWFEELSSTRFVDAVASKVRPFTRGLYSRIASEVFHLAQSSQEGLPRKRPVLGLLSTLPPGDVPRFTDDSNERLTSTAEILEAKFIRAIIFAMVLSASIRGNSNDLIALILEQNPKIAGDAHNIEYPDPTNSPLNTPLAEAILIRNLPLVRRLEEAGALQRLDRGGQFEIAFASAAMVGDAEYMRKLLALCPPAEPSAKARALEYAVRYNQTDIALELLDADAGLLNSGLRPTPRVLVEAVKNRNAQLVRAILNSDVFIHNGPEAKIGENIIAAALDKNSTKDLGFPITNKLLDRGCDANSIVARNEIISQTAILKAIEVGNKELVQLFINRRADIHQAPNFWVKRSPLQGAAEAGNLEIVKLLLEKGADVNCAPARNGGGTALQLAAISGNCNVVAELLTHQALLNTPPSRMNGRWPIEGAAEHGRLTMIELLWKANESTFYPEQCETGFEEKHCRRAMELAAKNGHMACRDLIAELSGLPIMDT
ncbi:hypothetical protein DL767_000084 [Monosporascus sp. MG133]|nr:hypothetical protein DL767_000084 [Monosporascus sp. MG133]